MKKKSVIRQWQIQKRSGKHCLVGEIVSHPKLIEGERTISEPLLFVDFRTMTAETIDMAYILL